MRLRDRLTYSYGAITLVVLAMAAALISVGSNRMVTQNVAENVLNTTTEVGHILDNYISDAEDITSLIFSNTDVYEYNHDKYVVDEYEKIETEAMITEFLNSITIYKSYSDFMIVYRDGEYLGQISSTTRELFENENIFDKLSDKLSDKNEVWFCGYENDYRRLYFAKRLNSGAIVLTSFFYREFDEVFDSVKKSDMETSIVSDGVIIYAPEKKLIGSNESAELMQSIEDNRTGAFVYGSSIVSFYYCNNGWLLVTKTSLDNLNEIMEYIIRVTVFAVVSSLLVVFVAGFLIANSVQSPIAGMAEAIKQVEGGNFNVKIPDNQTREIHDLSVGLASMVASVKENIEIADNANKEKSKFLANTSHEIRTPMNAIIGYADMIIEEGDEASIARATTIRTAARNLLTIVNDILDFSKIEAGKIELKEDNYNIENVMEEVAGIIRIPAGQKDLAFEAELINKFPAVLYGDDIKLRQILINLANNSIKFTNTGYVKITGKCEPFADDNTKVKMIFQVIDTGIGIKPEDIGKVFGAFEQVDAKNNRKKEGSGLGLSIAKEFARMMGGDITVESDYGRGTVFKVEVISQVASWLGEEEKPVNVVGKKLLLVDDNETNLILFENMLEPYKVVTERALSGAEVLEKVENNSYDMIFMDHYMPDMNGDDVTREIRSKKNEDERFEKVPIIGYTADNDAETTKLCLSSGMNDCTMKPVSKKKLEDLFRRFLMIMILGILVIPTEACAISEFGTTLPELESKKEIEFSWWGDDERHEFVLDLIDEYERQHQDIDIIPQYTEEGAYEKRTQAMFYAGKEADVMQVDYDWLGLYSSDGSGFYNLNSLKYRFNTSNYPEDFLESAVRYGRQNAFPTGLDMQIFYINENFCDANFLQKPLTWNDLHRMGRVVKNTGDALICVDSVEELLYMLIAYTEQVSGRPMYTEGGTLKFGKAEFEIMLKEYVSLINDNVIKPFGSDDIARWKEGRRGFTLGWISEADDLTKDFDSGKRIEIAGFPVMTEARYKGLYARPSGLYAIADDAKYPEESADFMSFLFSHIDDVEGSGLKYGAPMSRFSVDYVEKNRDAGTGFKAANLLYETDYSIQEPRMNGADNLTVFKEVFTDLGFEQITVEEAVDILFLNLY